MQKLFPLLLLSSIALSADGQHRDRFLHWAVNDAAGLGKSFVSHLPGAASVATGLLISSRGIDPGFNDGVRAWSSGSVDTYLRGTNSLGGPAMTRRAAGIFALTLLTNNTRAQDAAFTSLESVVYAGALSYAIKYALGRGRPSDGHASDHFAPFSGNSSFPSGHTTTAFAIVTPWVLYFPTPAMKALYALPVGTALARMDRDKHWATDVIAGAALGVFTARYLVRRHTGDAGSRLGPRVRLGPTGGSVEFRW